MALRRGRRCASTLPERRERKSAQNGGMRRESLAVVGRDWCWLGHRGRGLDGGVSAKQDAFKLGPHDWTGRKIQMMFRQSSDLVARGFAINNMF
eukprot:scaffold1757_cov266-Pinguiococcus_pyrenoidosus.AAC.4